VRPTGGGSQSYNQTIACASAAGAHTITQTNTATISETGQTAAASATIHCSAPTTLTTTLSKSQIAAGGGVSDQATISGAQTGAGGTMSYKVYSDNACNTRPIADATPTPNTVANGRSATDRWTDAERPGA
jgi:hypothetical protein